MVGENFQLTQHSCMYITNYILCSHMRCIIGIVYFGLGVLGTCGSYYFSWKVYSRFPECLLYCMRRYIHHRVYNLRGCCGLLHPDMLLWSEKSPTWMFGPSPLPSPYGPMVPWPTELETIKICRKSSSHVWLAESRDTGNSMSFLS